MIKEFSEWYRLVGIEPDEGMLNKRWAGVEEWCKETKNDVQSMLEIVRLFVGLPPTNTATLTRFAECFRKHDQAFPQRNPLELQVLGGAAIANCVTTERGDGERGIIVGLAVASAAFRIARSRTKISEIEEWVRKYFLEISWRRRDRERDSKKMHGFKSIDQSIKSFTDSQNQQQMVTALSPLLESLSKTIKELHVSLDALYKDLDRTDEECNMLWWLEGGCSRDLKKPWKKITKESLPIIAAKELADLTEVLPGPHHAHALLHRVISQIGVSEVTLADAVNAVPTSWLRSCIESRMSSRVSDLTPMWNAMKTRAPVDDKRTWQAFYKKSCDVDVGRKLKAADLSAQLYIETLLLKSLDIEK